MTRVFTRAGWRFFLCFTQSSRLQQNQWPSRLFQNNSILRTAPRAAWPACRARLAPRATFSEVTEQDSRELKGVSPGLLGAPLNLWDTSWLDMKTRGSLRPGNDLNDW